MPQAQAAKTSCPRLHFQTTHCKMQATKVKGAAVPSGSGLCKARYRVMDRCSEMTFASAMLGMHSINPSSGEVASTLRPCSQQHFKIKLMCLTMVTNLSKCEVWTTYRSEGVAMTQAAARLRLCSSQRIDITYAACTGRV